MSIISMRKMAARQSGTIARVKGGGEVGLRIREMGLTPGAAIVIVGRAPLNDPVHIKLYGHSLTLRNNEADHIMVEVAAAPSGAEGAE
ncbi:MAG: FeoA domain-containing protein [Candidatus Adiutrix sp.]|jgi:ferrous iron transport protein A|nr:FeoA domain-containing protein [Candidatus Adiutrix sp.]